MSTPMTVYPADNNYQFDSDFRFLGLRVTESQIIHTVNPFIGNEVSRPWELQQGFVLPIHRELR